jgi:hypothetical protein
MSSDVFEHDDVAGTQLLHKDSLDERLEHLSIGRTLDRHHGADASEVERADHGRDGACVARNGPVRAFACGARAYSRVIAMWLPASSRKTSRRGSRLFASSMNLRRSSWIRGSACSVAVRPFFA